MAARGPVRLRLSLGQAVTSEPDLQWVIQRLSSQDYAAGLHGTCYECPFASDPLGRDGLIAEWREVSNDPTEAYFRCSLPTRDADRSRVAWGEHAPCTILEWTQYVAQQLKMLDIVKQPIVIHPAALAPRQELLTADELHAITLTVELAKLCFKIIGDPGGGDTHEIVLYIHAIQRMIMSQAAARAYPETFRLLGKDSIGV